MTTPNLSLPELAASQSQPHTTINAALRRLDALVQLTVTSISNAPPGSPADGDRYIVGTSPSGVWIGHDNEIAAFIGTAWVYWVPDIGWQAFVQDVAAPYVYGAGSPIGWEALSTGGGGGGGGEVTPDSVPASPNASDDEFDDSTLDTATQWQYGSAWSVGSVAYEGQSQGAYVMRLDPNGTAHSKAYAQAHSGATYKYRAKVRLFTVDADGEALDDPGNYARVEIFVAQSSDNKRVSCVLERNGGTWHFGARRTTGTTYNSAATYAASQIVNGLPAYGLYLEIEDDGTNHYFRVSPSGYDGTFAVFRQESRTTHLSGTPDRVGFAAAGADATHTVAAVFEWFRRIS